MNLRLAFITLLFLGVSGDAFAGTLSCSQFLRSQPEKSSKHLAKELDLVGKLNPTLIEKFNRLETSEQNLTQLYLLLKVEAWNFLPRGMVPWKNKPELPKLVIENVLNNSPDAYETSQLKPDDIYMFYANALQGRYISVARHIRNEFIDDLKVADKKTRRFLEKVYEDIMETDLGLAETSPERARDTLSANIKTDVDWSLLIQLSSRYFKKSENIDLNGWIAVQPELRLVDSNEVLLLRNNVEKEPKKKRYCCLNSPGCLFCPNNRSYLK